MLTLEELCVSARVEAGAVRVWVEEGWLLPRQDEAGFGFSDVDVARAQLIRDLKGDLGVNDEGVGVILDLLDQVHGLRRTLECLLQATKEARHRA